VSCIDQLFDEELLIGTGWTTRETVRYSNELYYSSSLAFMCKNMVAFKIAFSSCKMHTLYVLFIDLYSRSLAYSILADLVHHVRSHLSLAHLSLAVHLFSKNVHDDTLSVSIQTMSCKVSCC